MKLKLLLCLLMITSLSFGQKDSTNVDSFQETDKVLSEVVKKALIVAEKTGDFVIEQAPMLLQEFYNWHIFSHIFFICIGIIIILFSRYAPYLWLEKEEDVYNDVRYFSRYGEEGVFFGYALFLIGGILGFIITLIDIYNLIYILVAPKLYLIDYFINQN